jgi:serine/threonine-protein kinase HipA
MKTCPICLERTDSEAPHRHCVRELYGTETVPPLDVALADLERLATQTVNHRLSVTGVQKKLSLSNSPGTDGGRLTIVGALGGTHILKPPAPEYPGMPQLEHWTMRLAHRCGLETASSGLVFLASGEASFLVRRFDRAKGRRIHVEDLCQLSEQPTADKYRSSMERVASIVRRLTTAPGDDALRLFDLTVFCLLVGNSDMHLKNWSLVQDENRVRLSPAYDLLPTRLLLSDPEESALPIHGRKARLERADLLALAAHARIPEKVARTRMDSTTRSLLGALEELPSPWVAPVQAEALREHVATMADRISK